MKKLFAVLLTFCSCMNLICGCGSREKINEVKKVDATDKEAVHLESLYQDKEACHGDMHGHTKSSEFSDGRNTLQEWKTHMMVKEIDFATVVDHRQVLHMWHEEWDDTLFVGGSEPGMTVTGTQVISKENIDYSMIFTKPEGLEAVLKTFASDYDYGFQHGRFKSIFRGDHEKIAKLIQCIKDNGGMFVYVHPFGKEGYYDPVDYMNYWFADETGFEVLNGLNGEYDSEQNAAAYECWVKLLEAGKRIWATSGSDSHKLPYQFTLTTLYTAQKNAQGYFDQMRTGNITAGPIGIRIAVGDAVTGGVGSFEGNQVVVAVGDFHSQVTDKSHKYRVDIYDDTGLVSSQELTYNEMNYFAFDADPSRKFYRANVFDVSTNKIVAVGNPVWNG